MAVAAAMVPCSIKTIYRRIDDGSLTKYEFGRKVLVDLDELDALIQGGDPPDRGLQLEDHVRKALAAAPPLSRDQRHRIARLLVPELQASA